MAWPLRDRTLILLEDLPPFIASSTDVQGTFDVMVGEIVRFEAAMSEVIDNAFPGTAERMLPILEAMLGIVPPVGASVAERRTLIKAHIQKLKAAGTGEEWEAAMTLLVGSSGWTYREHDPADGTSPSENHVVVTLPGALTDDQREQIKKLAREITPAHIDLDFASTSSFIIGVDIIGDDPL